MKSILLATASILAFAGAAAAEVSFGGDATVGFNLDDEDENDNGIIDTTCGAPVEVDEPGTDGFDCEDGFFWEANLGVTLSQELNNGLTAAASFTLTVADQNGDLDGDGGDVHVDDDFLLSLTGETGGLFLGDTAFAAETHWDPAGEMLADDFSEQDGENVLRGDILWSGVEASVSYVLTDDDNDTPEDELDQLSLGAAATFGAFNVTLGYQEESEIFDANYNPLVTFYDPQSNDDFDGSEVFGISAGTTFGGADVQVAWASNMTFNDDSLGFEVSYPFGPVTLGAYYVIENNDDSDFDPGNDELNNSFGVSADYASGPLSVSAFYEFEDDETDDDNDGSPDDDISEDDDFGVEVAYDSGTGIEVFAGWIDSTEGYVGVEYDLGNGAQLIASWAEQDEEGVPEYEEGATVAVEFEF